jgi:hypothetical protein
VKHLDQISTAAVDNLLIQQHANLLIIPQFSRRLVQELIAMHLMMAPALSLVKLMNMTLFSVLPATSIYFLPQILLL